MADRSVRSDRDDKRNPPPARIETAYLRQLPNFIIIGAQRGGTTSLYRYLTEHPQIGAAFRKEVHYFDRYFDRGMNWYRAHFPEYGVFSIVGEASPYYLFHPVVPERVRAAVPEAKLIVLLRNPVDRAFSQYQMNVRKRIESRSFDEVIAREPEAFASSDDPLGSAWRHQSCLARGVYADQLRRWFGFFPREQMLILKSEEFYAQPERILHQTQEFLGLQPHTPAEFKVYHESDYPQMDPAIRRQLIDYFAPRNRQLYDLLGREFGWEYE